MEINLSSFCWKTASVTNSYFACEKSCIEPQEKARASTVLTGMLQYKWVSVVLQLSSKLLLRYILVLVEILLQIEKLM